MSAVGEDRAYIEIYDTVQLVLGALKRAEIKHMVCGGIRRGARTVKVVDIAVLSPLPRVYAAVSGSSYPSFFDRLEKWDPEYKTELLTKKKLEKAKRMDLLIDEIPFSFHAATEDNWGAMVLYLTGNSVFNIKLRSLAKQDRMKLNQYGLWHGQEIIAGKTEDQIFMALGLDYIAPEIRTTKTAENL